MNLKECIEQNMSQPRFYVGASSGFLFIGNYEEAKSKIPDISKKILSSAELSRISKTRSLQKANEDGHPARRKKDTEKSYAEACANFEKRKEVLKKEIKKLIEYESGFIPLEERQVREAYKTPCSNNGFVILIEGNEQGNYWMIEELEDEKICKTTKYRAKKRIKNE